MARRSHDEKIADIQKKIEKLKAEAREEQKKKTAEERRKRTKHLIQIGGAVYSVLGDSYREGDVEKLIAFLRQQDQRGNYFSSAMGRSHTEEIEELDDSMFDLDVEIH